MSRYRRIICGEVELPEISGTKFVIYPTLETRMELLEHIKSTQIIEEVDEKDDKGKIISTKRVRGKYMTLTEIAKTCAKVVYEGCWEHDGDGNRTVKKEEEKTTSEKDILSLVLHSDIMTLYVHILQELELIGKDNAQVLLEGQKKESEKKN